MIAPMKWNAYRIERNSQYVIHVEVDAGPFVFHRYGTIDDLTLFRGKSDAIFKEAIAVMTEEITATVHRIRGTLGKAVDDYFLKGVYPE